MIVIDDIVQNSLEWKAEKAGKPSASKMFRIITPSGKPSKQREGYLYELVAERITGQLTDSYQSNHMQNGLEREDESRQFYELIHGVEVEQVGLIYQDQRQDRLCSPDGLINRNAPSGPQYGLELKNVIPKTQVKYLLDRKLPDEYFIQIQASLMITGYDQWAFFSYCPGFKPLDLMIDRDKEFIIKLKVELDSFCEELDRVTKELS